MIHNGFKEEFKNMATLIDSVLTKNIQKLGCHR